MSVKVSALCWELPLSVTDKLVLLRLAEYADTDGGSIFPAVATVAHFCGLSPRAVQYILKKFLDTGLLVIVGNEGGGRGKARHYAIDLERAGQMAGSSGGAKNGTGKRVQRVQESLHPLATPDDPAETVQRVQTDAEKGATAIAPDLSGTVIEESKGSLCVELESTRAPEPAAAGHTQGAPEFSETKSANVVQFAPPGGRSPIPVGWVLPAPYRAYAEAAGQTNIDGAARRFAVHWSGRGAKTEAEWQQAWENWIDENIERGYGNGQQRHDYRQRSNGDLAAVILADLTASAGNPEGSSHGWRRG